MSSPSNLSTALAFVPNWWKETSDPAAFNALLIDWARAAGWRAAGFVWPVDMPVVRIAAQNGTSSEVLALEAPDAARRIKAGEGSVLYPLPGTAGRVYAAVYFSGRPLGLVWAEKPAGQPWSDAERAYLVMTASMMERSPAVAAAVGPTIDPERLDQRLADAAVIAGRIAHDFDNILTGIIGFADLTMPLLPPQSQQAGFVSEMSKVGHRGIIFTQQLHQLSRSGQAKPGAGLLMPALMKEESRLRQLATGVQIEKDLPPNLPSVALDAVSLQTVLGHVMQNAVEACPPGGLVRIIVRSVDLTEAEARTFLGKVDRGVHLQIAIADTGSGIKPEVRRRLFADPFYTTKVRHRGLGLAVAYRILTAHRGGILLEPVPLPGTGTVARVVLPLAAARSLAMTPSPVGFRDEGRTSFGALNATIVGG